MRESLDRFIARRAKLAWAEARSAIHGRRVSVDGVVCKHYHRGIGGTEAVSLDGAPLADGVDDGVILCHKPMGVACSHLPADAPLLYEMVPAHLRHPDLQAAGRLDRDTTGLIVLTIDGALIQGLTGPRRGCWKRYRVRYSGTLAADACARVASGLMLPDDPIPCRSARLEVLRWDNASGNGEAVLELCEGRHHQVKRMIAALGGRVTALHRDRVGGLDLPHDLPYGGMRPATPAELAVLPVAVLPVVVSSLGVAEGARHP
ncbi:MAG: 16S rRNA pseudouridine(516) synthase [Planctomycetes bacterium]|nr:16S rRNA pseudouridine(516) synthase [Planctomycetota bacterium]